MTVTRSYTYPWTIDSDSNRSRRGQCNYIVKISIESVGCSNLAPEPQTDIVKGTIDQSSICSRGLPDFHQSAQGHVFWAFEQLGLEEFTQDNSLGSPRDTPLHCHPTDCEWYGRSKNESLNWPTAGRIGLSSWLGASTVFLAVLGFATSRRRIRRISIEGGHPWGNS